MPHYFKSVYLPDDKFLLIGGVERDTSFTTNRCFLLDDKGKLSIANDMHEPRQYFTVATDYANDLIYILSGYNHLDGVIDTFETFSIRARKWVLCDR